MWLIAALAGFAVSALVGILDKFVLTKAAIKPLTFVFYSAVFVLPLFILVPFGVQSLAGWRDWSVAFLSGIAFALGLWAMYVGFEESEVSHAGPLAGAAVAMFVLLLSPLFLGEQLSRRELLAVVLLIIGSLIISFEKSAQHNGWHQGMAWELLAGLGFAVSHVAAKYIYDGYGFYSGFVWTRGALGLCGLVMLLWSSVRQSVFRRRATADVVETRRRLVSTPIILVGVNKLLAVAAILLVQYAIALGSVTVVNALAGVQYAALIILVALLSKFRPKLFKEDYARSEIVQEILAVVMIGAGLAVLV